MSDATDILKSIVRSTAGDFLSRIRNTGLSKAIGQAIGDIRAQRSRISAKELSAACADIRGVKSITIGFVGGKLDVYVERDGSDIGFQLEPGPIRFAPRGAKEVSFFVHPAEASTGPLTSDIVGRIAGEVAARLWSFSPNPIGGAAIADRDGRRLSLDLRDTPVGRGLRGSPMEILLEAIELRSLRVEDDALVIQIGLPRPLGV